MIGRENLKEDLANNPLKYLQKYFPEGQLNGNEYQMGSVQGEAGKSLSFNIEKGTWSDFASDDMSGKGFTSLWAARTNMSWQEAFNDLCTAEGLTEEKSHKRPPQGKSFPHELSGKKFWEYQGGDGWPVMYVQRIDQNGGKKIFIPFTWDGEEWVKKALPSGRPLYRLPDVLTAEYIVVTEGEKAADAAQKFTDKYISTTWHGGTNAIEKTNWNPLKGKNVLLWADADAPGQKAMDKIASKIAGMAKSVKVIDVSGFPKKSDAADFNPDPERFQKMLETAREVRATEQQLALAPTEVLSADVSAESFDKIMKKGNYPSPTMWSQIGITITKATGNPHCNYNNVYRVLEKYYPENFFYCEFSNKILTTFKSDTPRVMDDRMVSRVQGMLQGWGFSNLGVRPVERALAARAIEYNRRNTMTEWLDSLEWDGRPRIEEFFQDYFGVRNTALNKAISKNFLLSLVARGVRPGAKVDYTVILESPQGLRKGEALKALVTEELYAGLTEAINSDTAVLTEGKMIAEVPEMHTILASGVDKAKAFLTTSTHTLRRPYEKHSSPIPMTAVFVGSTNKKVYLTDKTGNRRFWPLRIKYADDKGISENREQFFAEAYLKYKQGDSWWEYPKKDAEKEVAKRTRIDFSGDKVAWWVGKRTSEGHFEFTIPEIALGALEKELYQLSEKEAMDIEESMLDLGYERAVGRLGMSVYRLPNVKKEGEK